MSFDAKVPVEIVAPDGRHWIRALGATAFVQVTFTGAGTNFDSAEWDETAEFTAEDLKRFERVYSGKSK